MSNCQRGAGGGIWGMSSPELSTRDPRLLKRKFASNQGGDTNPTGVNSSGRFKWTTETSHVPKSNDLAPDSAFYTSTQPDYHCDPYYNEFINSTFPRGSTGQLTGPVPVPLLQIPRFSAPPSTFNEFDTGNFPQSFQQTNQHYSSQGGTNVTRDQHYAKMSLENVLHHQPQFDPSVPPPMLFTHCPPVGFPAPIAVPSVAIAKKEDTSPTSKEATPMKQNDVNPCTAPAEKKSALSSKIMIGKRRGGGKMLPIGVIKRPDVIKPAGKDVSRNKPKEPWSRYMAEVEHYKSQSCSEEAPNRSLVK